MRGEWQQRQGSDDDMVSVARAVVEAISELRIALGSLGGRIASFRPLGGGDELAYTATAPINIRWVFVANVGGAATDMRLHHVPFGGVPDQQNALYFDTPIADGGVVQLGTNIRLAAGDTIYVRASTGGNLSFNIYGL